MITLQICATHALHCMHNLKCSVEQRIELNSDGLKSASKACSSYHIHRPCNLWNGILSQFCCVQSCHQKHWTLNQNSSILGKQSVSFQNTYVASLIVWLANRCPHKSLKVQSLIAPHHMIVNEITWRSTSCCKLPGSWVSQCSPWRPSTWSHEHPWSGRTPPVCMRKLQLADTCQNLLYLCYW